MSFELQTDPSREDRIDQAREEFLVLVDHRPEHHRSSDDDLDLDLELAGVEHWKREAPWKLATAGELREDCSWWWCVSPEQVTGARGWRDLLAAAEFLRRHGHNLQGPKAASVLLAHGLVDLDRKQAEGLGRLHAAIVSVDAASDSDAGILKDEFLRRLEPQLQAARAALGRGARGGRPIDRAIEEALEAGAALGWNHHVVAALLLLSGIEPSIDWEDLQENVRKADDRRKLRKTAPP